MNKYLFFLCAVILVGCSKNDETPMALTSSAELSHITDADLALIDDSIQLTISREEALIRGVPASEYDCIEEALIRHNERTTDLLTKLGKERMRTKSDRYGNTMAFGMLQDPPVYHMNYVYSIPLNVANENNMGGIILSYTLFGNGGSDFSRHVLKYTVTGPLSAMGEIERYGYTIEDLPLPGFTFGWLSLEYSFYGSDYGMCIYQIFDNT